MKLIFFLVAFFLVSIRVYFSWSGKDKERRGIAESNMVITSDHFREEMKYAGRFLLTEDEMAFKSISPGGYFKWKRNEQRVNAESNLQGNIDYSLFDGKSNLALDVNGKRLLAESLKEMISWGFDAEARMERIYKKGGDSALLSQVDSMKTDWLKLMYLNRLMVTDSLSPEKMAMITLKIGALGPDHDKAIFLEKIPSAELSNVLVAQAYFKVLSDMGSDFEKAGAIQHIIYHDSLSDENIRTIIEISGRLGSDMDKANIFSSMIDKGMISGSCYNDLLSQVSNMGSDMDKVNLYSKLSMGQQITETQWISMLNNMSHLGSDMDKANLLILATQKMPKTQTLKETYLAAAKSIHNDSDYGRAIRAIE
jgi:hypothetical protein